MADVSTKCPQCGHDCTISEHVESQTVPCPSCGGPVPVPTAINDSKLALKKAKSKDFLVEAGPEAARLPGMPTEADSGPRGMDRVHIARSKVNTPKAMISWFTFLIVGGLLLGLQYGFEKHPEMTYLGDYYIWSRAAIGAICVIVLLLTAFEDNIFQGIFCLLFFPYAVYYVFARSDSYMLRGAFFALMVSLSAELYFLRDQALWIQMQGSINTFIDEGHGLIQRAGDAPTY